MKYILLVGLLLCPATMALAQLGPVTHADVSAVACGGGNTLVLAVSSTPSGSGYNRTCAFITNSSANAARCGDINTSATQGNYIGATGGSASFCTISAIYCCGVGGIATINSSETTK